VAQMFFDSKTTKLTLLCQTHKSMVTLASLPRSSSKPTCLREGVQEVHRTRAR